MKRVKLLDCTLRDGGYVNGWRFSDEQISFTVSNLVEAGLDFIEVGFLTSILQSVGGSQFRTVQDASRLLSRDKSNSKYLMMADVSMFDTDTLCGRDEGLIDGIRVVFYKRQIEQAVDFCAKIVEKGYDLFLQPMVTVDYSAKEYEALIRRFCKLYSPFAVSIVDSFGSMRSNEVVMFANILDGCLDKQIRIGFHGHDNMQMSQINAMALLEGGYDRELMLDASVNGMGRGAGNLRTELIANFLNISYGSGYVLDGIFRVMGEVTLPIAKENPWGYSPYFLLTALKKAHPNFATYLLEKHDIGIDDFKSYLELIPDEMLTKCTRPYVEELHMQFERNRPQSRRSA